MQATDIQKQLDILMTQIGHAATGNSSTEAEQLVAVMSVSGAQPRCLLPGSKNTQAHQRRIVANGPHQCYTGVQ